MAQAARVAEGLVRRVRTACGLAVCCGVGPNKLVAKLASGQAKAAAARGGARVWAAGGAAEVETLLRETPAHKLPGLGGKAEALGVAGLASAADLRALDHAQLQARLGLAEGAAAAAHARCRGRCDALVAASPPKSTSVTSWLAHELLRDLALTRHLGRGGPGVTVGGWLFEPHRGACKSNETRARWVLLALCLDLEERLAHHALEHAELPAKLSLCWQGCGVSPTPGLGHRAGPTHTRTAPLSPTAFASARGSGGGSRARGGVPYLQSDLGASGEEMISPATLVLDGATAAERAAAVARLEAAVAGTREARVAALVRAAAGVLAAWAAELPAETRIAQLTLNAHSFVPCCNAAPHRAAGAAAGSPQLTIRALLGREPPPATPAAPVVRPCATAVFGVASASASSGASGGGGGGSACVVHLDIDNFYCAVEVADEPALRGMPLAVTQGNAGGFVALSVEAKAAGIRKGDGVGERGRRSIAALVAMGSISTAEARARCAGLVIRPMRTDRYLAASQSILKVLQRWGPTEKTSYDDFYVDVTAPSRAAAAEAPVMAAVLPTEARVWSGGRARGGGGCCATEAGAEAEAESAGGWGEEDWGDGWGDGEASRCAPGSVAADRATELAADPAAGLATDLAHACRLASEMRTAVLTELGFPSSTGVGRTKLAVRLLSACAKPAGETGGGLVALCDTDAAAFIRSRRLLTIPGLQAKRGHALAHTLVGVGAAASASELTLGCALRLGRPLLARLLGGVGAAELVRLASGARGSGGGSGVVERGPPKSLAAEVSFPPTADTARHRQTLHELSATLLRRCRADGRPPRRLVLAWRCGYASWHGDAAAGAGGSGGADAGGGAGGGAGAGAGALRSHRLPWPAAAAAWVVAPRGREQPQQQAAEGDCGSGRGGAATAGGGANAACGGDADAAAHALVAVALGGLATRAGGGAALTRLVLSADSNPHTHLHPTRASLNSNPNPNPEQVLSAEYGGEGGGAAAPLPGGMDRFVVRRAAEAAEAAEAGAAGEAVAAAAAVGEAGEVEEAEAGAAAFSRVEEVVAEAWEAAGAAEAHAGRAILMEPWDEWEGEDGACWGGEEDGWEEWGEEAEPEEREGVVVEPPPKKARLGKS